MNLIDSFKGKLIVSCQALEGEPLCVPGYMAKMALAAKIGGAVGIRANGPEDIKSIKKETNLPIIGIWKQMTEGCDVYITPTFESAKAVCEAGADIIAIDCTFRKNAEGRFTWELIKEIKEKLNVLVMADISTVEEGLNAEKAGADLVSTTLSGYTSYSKKTDGPDFELISALSSKLSVPLMVEGRIWTTDHAKKAFELGAYAIIVGGAITRPHEITGRFVKAIEEVTV